MAETGHILLIVYIKRNPSLSRAEFYDHWKDVHGPKVIPWAEKHGIRRYQQVHSSGTIIPTASAPDAIHMTEASTEPMEFDGIAQFTVPSLKQHADAHKDPYYLNVVEPDEWNLIDKGGPGGGIVTTYHGQMLDMVHAGQNAIGDKGEEYRKEWEEWEKKA